MIVLPYISIHLTSAFPFSFTQSESILYSFASSNVICPVIQSPQAKVLFLFMGLYPTEKLLTLFDMICCVTTKQSYKVSARRASDYVVRCVSAYTVKSANN